MTRATVNNPSLTPVPIILIVDDDAELRGLLSMVFKRAAYTLIEAATGDAALAACQTQRPDLILLDMMMPRMSGVTACEKIRALPGYAYVPILMITALQDTASITHAFEAGATDYVTKPLNPVVLRHRVDQLLRSDARRGPAARQRTQISQLHRAGLRRICIGRGGRFHH